jgi:hypothetical protein
VWVDFLGGLHQWQSSWCKGEKYDNMEGDLNYYDHIRSLGFRGIREPMTLWGLILQSVGCICTYKAHGKAGHGQESAGHMCRSKWHRHIAHSRLLIS